MLLAFLLSCTSSNDDTTTPPSVETADTAVTLDTGWSPGDYGSFFYSYDVQTQQAVVSAIAVQTTPGFINLPDCIARDVTCLPVLPKGEDTFVDFVADQRVDLELLRTRYIGRTASFGPFEMPLVQDQDTQATYYTTNVQGGVLDGQQAWISWPGGFWSQYRSDDIVQVSPPIELIAPAAGSFTEFTNGDQFVIEWVPTGDGIVTLEATSRFGFSRIYRLADDGLFALDIDSLPWQMLTQDVSFALKRWDRGDLRVSGHVVDIAAMSQVTFEGQFFNVGDRDRLRPANTCNAALGLNSLPPGGWWSTFDGLSGSATLPGVCNGVGAPGPSGGPDAIYRVDVPPRTLLKVEYIAYGDNGVLGIATDCPINANNCVAKSETDNRQGQPEFGEFFNLSDSIEDVYVFLDTEGAADPTFYTLDVDIDQLGAPTMFNTCGDVDLADTLLAGSYYVQFNAYSNDLNPGDGGCTQSSAPGGESIVPITVPAGQSVQINIDMPDGNPSLYLLTNCNDAFQCVAGVDDTTLSDETLLYTNNGAADENLFLVVDTEAGQTPYFMSVVFF